MSTRFPLRSGPEPVIFEHVKEEWRARVWRGYVEERNVERQVLGKRDRLFDRVFCFAGQTNDEVAPVADARLRAPTSVHAAPVPGDSPSQHA